MQETNVKNLRINRLTEEQYETAVKSDTELYLTPDTTDQDIADAIATHNSSSSAHSTLLSGYVVTSRKINNKALTADITLTASDVGAISSHQDIKTLKTDNTTAQTTSSSETIAGSGTINLHKVSKTGSYSDLLNKPTIPATNVIPATTTANKVLISTTTSGTAKWSDFSSAGFLKTNTSGVISVDTTTYYSKPSGGIPSTDLAESYYLASNPSGYTSNAGTVTSVRVQATSPVTSSQNTAQTGTLNTTIALANAYGDTKNPYGTKTANYVLAGPTSGSAAAPTFRALEKSDIPLASETAASGGTTTSLVTTGEKYTWNNKQNAISDLNYIRNKVALVDDKIGSQDITSSGSSLPVTTDYTIGDTFLNTTDNKLYTAIAPAYQASTNTTISGTSDLNTGIVSNGGVYRSMGQAYSPNTDKVVWLGDTTIYLHFKFGSIPNDTTNYAIFRSSTTAYGTPGSNREFQILLYSKQIHLRLYYRSGYGGSTIDADDILLNTEIQANTEYYLKIEKIDTIAIATLMTGSYDGTVIESNSITTQDYMYYYQWNGGDTLDNTVNGLYLGQGSSYYGTATYQDLYVYLLDSSKNYLVADGALQWDSGVTLEDNIQYNDTTNEKTYYYNNSILYQNGSSDVVIWRKW